MKSLARALSLGWRARNICVPLTITPHLESWGRYYCRFRLEDPMGIQCFTCANILLRKSVDLTDSFYNFPLKPSVPSWPHLREEPAFG